RWSSSPRSGTVSCSDSISRATKKAATWLPLPCTIRPLAVSNSTLTTSLSSAHPDGQRDVVHPGVRVVLVKVALDGHAVDRRFRRIVDPAVQSAPHSRSHRPRLGPCLGPARELHQRHRRPKTSLMRCQAPVGHPLVRDSRQRRLRTLIGPAADRENPGADQGGHLRRGQQALADQHLNFYRHGITTGKGHNKTAPKGGCLSLREAVREYFPVFLVRLRVFARLE